MAMVMDEDVNPHDVRSLSREFDDVTVLNAYAGEQKFKNLKDAEKYDENIERMYSMVNPVNFNFAVFAWGHLDHKNQIEPSHFTMDIFDVSGNVKLYLSHAEKGQELIQFQTILNQLVKNKSEKIHYWPGSAIFFGEFIASPQSVLMTIVRWWFYYDKIAKLGNYPSSCSGSVETVLWNHCPLMRELLCPKFFYQKHLYGKMNDLKFYDCPSNTVLTVDLTDNREEEPKQKRERRKVQR
jgi:hypothetical protein